MIHFDGDRQLPAPPAETFVKLRDARFLVQCVQGGQATSEPATEDEAQCIVRPNLPFARGATVLTLKITEAEAPTKLCIMVLSQGSNFTSEVETHLTLSEHQEGTRVRWTADVKKLGGMLQMAPTAQVHAAAQKITQEVWSLLSARISR